MAIGLVLGGGAPNLPLMSGALLALDEAGVEFEVISTTGAGMLIGLLYAAPRKPDPDMSWEEARRAALRFTRDMGISDAIYSRFPVNYKIFNKTGPAAESYARAVQPYLWNMPRKTKSQRLFGDLMSFGVQAAAPSNLSSKSLGLCQPPPWVETFVDFDYLRSDEGYTGEFVLAAYCLDDKEEVHFQRDEITADHFRAGLAFPFIYEPFRLNGKRYLEGSAFDTLEFNPGGIMETVDTVVYLDLMGQKNLVQEPRNLLDAWAQSIIDPLTSIAEKDVMIADARNRLGKLRQDFGDLNVRVAKAELQVATALGIIAEVIESDEKPTLEEVEAYLNTVGDETMHFAAYISEVEREAKETLFVDMGLAHKQFDLLRMPYAEHIPDDKWRTILDWSWSNMSELFDIGVATGEAFIAENRAKLGLRGV